MRNFLLLLLISPSIAFSQYWGQPSFGGCFGGNSNSYYFNNNNFRNNQRQIFNPRAPYWQTYGLASYSNWNSPGAWGNGRMSSSYYPNNGHQMGAIAGKPIIYLHSKKNQQMTITPIYKNKDAQLLITSPSLVNGSWEIFVGPDEMSDSNGVDIPFLYIDYRSITDSYQFEQGRCFSSTKQSVQYVAEMLRSSYFNEDEIVDFTSYWSIKIPDNQEFCIFTQTEKELDPILSYEISVETQQIRRYFVFVAGNDPHIDKKKINKKIVLPAYPTLKSNLLKEWGVVFLAD